MLIGTIGVVVGGAISLALFGPWLPADAWQGMGALSGSWIGGSANMVAVGTSIGTRDDLFGIMIIVDTVVGYGWLGIVIFFSAYQQRLDDWNEVNTELIDELNIQMNEVMITGRRPMEFNDLIAMLALGIVGGI